MISTMALALQRIQMNIPREILDAAFTDELKERGGLSSLQQIIEDVVINKQVRNDVNLVGGRVKQIVLLQDYVVQMFRNDGSVRISTGPFAIYRIPPDERDDSAICEVMSLSYPGHLAGLPSNYGFTGAGVTLDSLANDVLESHTMAHTPARPTVSLIGADLVKLDPGQHAHVDWVLNCRIAYDQHFLSLNSSAKDSFAELCVCATKAYCWRKLIIVIKEGKIQFGANIDTFGSLIDGYAEEAKRYLELRDQFAGGAVLSPDRLGIILRHMC